MANETARKLRKSLTPQEVRLWLHLRELRKLGFHFRRQVPIGGKFQLMTSLLILLVSIQRWSLRSTVASIALRDMSSATAYGMQS
jgi:hypothetical protein